jgi:hypothetical protein
MAAVKSQFREGTADAGEEKDGIFEAAEAAGSKEEKRDDEHLTCLFFLFDVALVI